MKRAGKLTALALASLTTLSVLGGCAGNGETSSTASGDGTLEEYTVSIHMPGDTQDSEEKVEAKLNELMSDLNVKIDIQMIPVDEYKAQMDRILLGQEKADLVFTSSSDGYVDTVAKMGFAELDGLLEQYGKDITEAVYPNAFEGVKIDGKIYACPTNKEIDNGVAYAFNKELVDKYNFDLSTVKTLADIEPFLEVIKENEPDVTPAFVSKGNGLIEGDIPGWHTILNYAGYVSLEDDTLTVQNVLSEEFGAVEKEMYQLVRDWFEKGYVNADAETTDVGPWKAWQNKLMWVKKDITKPYRAEELQALYGQELVMVTVQDVVVKNTQGAMMAIARNSEDQERSMMVLNRIYADAEVYNTLVYGIEGENYEVVKEDPKTIRRISGSGYDADLAWRIGNQFNSYLLEGEAEDKWEKFAEYNESAEASPILGFNFDTTPVQNEIAQINNIYAEYWRGLCSGTGDVDTRLAERNERLKSAGIEKVTAEIQDQLNEWKANK